MSVPTQRESQNEKNSLIDGGEELPNKGALKWEKLYNRTIILKWKELRNRASPKWKEEAPKWEERPSRGST